MSKAVAVGISAALGEPTKGFFEQIYENDATVARMVSASRKKKPKT